MLCRFPNIVKLWPATGAPLRMRFCWNQVPRKQLWPPNSWFTSKYHVGLCVFHSNICCVVNRYAWKNIIIFLIFLCWHQRGCIFKIVRGTSEGTIKVFFLGTDLFILRRTSSEKKNNTQFSSHLWFISYTICLMLKTYCEIPLCVVWNPSFVEHFKFTVYLVKTICWDPKPKSQNWLKGNSTGSPMLAYMFGVVWWSKTLLFFKINPYFHSVIQFPSVLLNFID